MEDFVICTYDQDECNEFIIFDVIESTTKGLPRILPSAFTLTTLLIDRTLYELDLFKCLRTTHAVKHQLSIDFPRCEFLVDGRRETVIPDVPIRVARFCTQSVMALPLEVIQMSCENSIVSETKMRSPMVVHLYKNHVVFISKKLRIVSLQKSSSLPIEICIRVNFSDPVVNVDIKFDSISRLDDL